MVNVHEAKSSLSALLARVEQGEEIVIVRNGRLVAKLIRLVATPSRRLGSWRDLPGWSDFAQDPSMSAPIGVAEIAAERWL